MYVVSYHLKMLQSYLSHPVILGLFAFLCTLVFMVIQSKWTMSEHAQQRSQGVKLPPDPEVTMAQLLLPSAFVGILVTMIIFFTRHQDIVPLRRHTTILQTPFED